ncbi:MAG: GntR family transcriptional regulator [Ruminococcus sp.]|nr:GntR family transcriptional regulator [Ruminococcus sp.]
MWSFTNDKPVYVQIMDEIMNRISLGVYKPGERIPSVRDLAEEARVNPNTMQKALAEIERRGYIISLRTSGKFVTDDTELISSLNHNRAESSVRSFLAEIRHLGLSVDEAVELIRECSGELDNAS